jgi:hypothetical protein
MTTFCDSVEKKVEIHVFARIGAKTFFHVAALHMPQMQLQFSGKRGQMEDFQTKKGTVNLNSQSQKTILNFCFQKSQS